MISASLIYDGDKVILPTDLLPPGGVEKVKEKKQFEGTELEKLVEVAGRVCYDSFGVGRSSTEFHKHIQEVGHLSVLEHANITVRVKTTDILGYLCFTVNRPGMWVAKADDGFRVTCNQRALYEYSKWGLVESDGCMGIPLRQLASAFAPQIISEERTYHYPAEFILAQPASPEEAWVTLFLTCSRGCSHELVRHGDFTAFSQRSTRYVDESEGEWVKHPLLPSLNQHVINTCREAYRECVSELEKTVGRKQARGAARGYLGNALKTEIVMSANCAQWKHIISMRKNPAADEEISVLMSKAEEVLKGCRYGEYFK